MLILVCALFVSAGLEKDPAFLEAQQRVDKFEFDKAAAMFDEIAKRPGLADADKAVALVWLGLSYAELRDEARASIAFEDAVRADPLIGLPPDTSPKTKQLLEDARARARLRPKDPPAPTNPTTTTTTTTTPETAPTTTAAAEGDGGGSLLMPIGIAVAAVGGVIAVAGGVSWLVGVGPLRQAALDAEFQSDAAPLRDQSLAAQVGGQVALAVGLVGLAAGGVLLGVSFME